MNVAGMTTFALRAALESCSAGGRPGIALVPTGSIEQHGPRLPLNTDTTIARAAAEALDARSGGAWFVFPAIEYTCADSCRSFAGTVSVGRDAQRGVFSSTVESLRGSGFDVVVLVDAHEVNLGDLHEAAYRTAPAGLASGEGLGVLVLPVYRYARELAVAAGFAPGRHADWFEEMLFRQAGGVLPEGPEPGNDEGQGPLAGCALASGLPIELRGSAGVLGAIQPPAGAAGSLAELFPQTVEAMYSALATDIDLLSGTGAAAETGS